MVVDSLLSPETRFSARLIATRRAWSANLKVARSWVERPRLSTSPATTCIRLRRLACGKPCGVACALQLDAGDGQGCRIGHGLQRHDVGLPDVPGLRPVGPQAADRIVLPHRHDDKGPHQTRGVEVRGDAPVLSYIRDDRWLAGLDAPRAHPVADGEAQALPGQAGSAGIGVVTGFARSNGEGRAVGVQGVADEAGVGFDHLLLVGRDAELAYGFCNLAQHPQAPIRMGLAI